MPAKNPGKIKVLMAAAECAPFAKVGGLADVVGSLPAALHKLGVDVRVILPRYSFISPHRFGLTRVYHGLEVPSGRLLMKVDLYEGRLPGTAVPVYFVDCPAYFKDRSVYIANKNAERFLFFSLAALTALPALEFAPAIIHCHDSHTALIPDILKTTNLEYVRGLKTVYTIHNYQYQGKTVPEVLTIGNLNPDSLKTLRRDARDGDVNFMVQGVLNADLVTTVSPTYAYEITTSTYGAKLERIIRRRKADLRGILNGIDTKRYNPGTDPSLAARYTAASPARKAANKAALQKKLRLPIDPKRAVVAFHSRLVWQKGIDLVGERFGKLDAQYVFLGEGEKVYEDHIRWFESKNPRTVRAVLEFDDELAHLLFAGADIFLLPSRYEPCGLVQMAAMRYGALPVARLTGGLGDTIPPDVGFLFRDVTSSDLFAALRRALDTFYLQPDEWHRRVGLAMRLDFSWNEPAKEYVALYRELLKR